jgi:ABC-type glycerol-3-phosphate transport system substrate-binding protein
MQGADGRSGGPAGGPPGDAAAGAPGGRRRTRRGAARTAAALVAGGVLGGACARSPEPGGGSAAGGQAPPVALRWSTWGDGANPMVDGAAKGLALYRALRPHVTVTAEPQISTPGGSTYAEKIFAEWIAGTGPDVSGMCCNVLPDWGRQGLLTNLDAAIKRDARQVPLADYVAAQLAVWKSAERGQFALPMYMGVFGLFYSRTLFRRRGVAFPDDSWTWSQWREAMVRLTDPTEGTWGYFQAVNFPRTGLLIRQNGDRQVDAGDNRRAVFDSAPALGAIQWLHDRMHRDRALATPTQLAAQGFKEPRHALPAGKLGMLLDGSWTMARWLGEQPDGAADWDVAPLPRGAAQRDGGATVDGWCAWAGGKHQDESWELLKFLQSDPWLEIATTTVGQQPARKSWQDRYVDLTRRTYPALGDKQLRAFVDPIRGDYAGPEEFYLKDAEAKRAWADAVTATFTQNDVPVADAFRQAAQQVNRLHGL